MAYVREHLQYGCYVRNALNPRVALRVPPRYGVSYETLECIKRDIAKVSKKGRQVRLEYFYQHHFHIWNQLRYYFPNLIHGEIFHDTIVLPDQSNKRKRSCPIKHFCVAASLNGVAHGKHLKCKAHGYTDALVNVKCAKIMVPTPLA